MKDFIDPPVAALLENQRLASFEALWALTLPSVEQPNTDRGGWSGVARLNIGGRAFYLKRQVNHRIRGLTHPLGEPSLAREMRNISLYQQRRIPALEAAYFAQRRVAGQQSAILLTYALKGWHDLAHWQNRWRELEAAQRLGILQATGVLVRTLHQAGQVHRCLYPKHVFLRDRRTHFAACLIDLEKSRPAWLGQRDKINKDLEPLLRHSLHAWGETEQRLLLNAYLGGGKDLEAWLAKLRERRQHKELRG